MTDALPAVIPTDSTHAVDSYRVSTNAATLCGEIVKATATKIQGKRFVQIEGWLSIAAAHGCLVSISKVEAVDGGIRAIAELRRMSDGLVLATAEGFVGEDERMWAGRPLYARRAMAQTRASSRVCRSAFAHVVVLIDRDLGTTPAEEMMGVVDNGGSVDGPGSSWGPGGKQSAVDEAERDGLTANAPKVTAAKRAAFETWTKNAIGTLRLSGQTADSLKQLWESPEWAKKLDTLDDYAPDLMRKMRDAYDRALENAPKVAA